MTKNAFKSLKNRLMINKDKKNIYIVRPMADSKIKTSSPMTFNHFRYDVTRKRKKEKKCNNRSFSIGTSDQMLRHIILFLVATANSAREKC